MSVSDLHSLDSYMQNQAARIEQALQNVFPQEWEIPELLQSAMNYSLLNGGKRLRPLLVLAATEALQGDMNVALPVACAVEMIHTYSLIHDDLPAMDDDDYRRGKATNHTVFGEAMAILSGDALLTHAFYVMSQLAKQRLLPAEQALKLVEELSYYSGARGMVGGQVADIIGEQGITELHQLEYIHLHKTSDLIVFSLRAGGHVAGAKHQQLEALQTFGTCIGLAFQIQDDILDVLGDEQKMGKLTQSDQKANKATFPSFLGLETSRDKVKELTELGKQALLQGSFPDPLRLLQLADYLVRREF